MSDSTMKNIHTTPRSGMILMLMLAMMSLFAILIVGFMVVSSMANRQADSYQKKGRIQSHTSFAAAQEDTDAAVQTLLVGSTNPYSVIGPHSILENLYGHPGDETLGTDGDWLKGTVGTITEHLADPTVRPGTQRLEIVFDHSPTNADFWQQVSMIGNVLAFQNANRWESRRIVETHTDVAIGEIYVDIIKEADDPSGDIYINAAPYSGEGVLGSGFELEPNPTDPAYQTALDDLWLLNPDYTAPDVANMFLAWRYDDTDSIPSFHRPSLFTQLYATPDPSPPSLPPYYTLTDERKVSLRPLMDDHPQFTGSNLAYDPEIGPWDVDNDRDGETDSVWVYTGMPARRSKDGKMYIPLVAYLVRDLDGRVNVNVAGNERNTITPGAGTLFDEVAATTSGHVYGSGYGPAEIDLSPVLPTAALDLLQGESTPLRLRGRNSRVAGTLEMGEPLISEIQFFGFPFEDGTISTPPNNIFGGIAPDLWGIFAVGTDTLGNRQADRSYWGPTTWHDIYTDNPYLFDPYHQTPYSQPFTLTEFETLLRPYDGDSLSLPQRLQHLFFGDSGATGINPVDVDEVRNITVISSDIPSPNRRMRGEAGVYSLIYNCALAENPGDAALASDITEDLMARLPEGIRQGLRIDLNQLVKSPDWSGGNHLAGLQARAQYAQGIYILLMAMCYKQLDGGTYTAENTAFGANATELIKTRLAQWAVNIIDFADPDAVMTPMLFDMNPFDGLWNAVADTSVDLLTEGDLTGNPDINLVWGMERPDLVLTETMAFHNRRVADTNLETSGEFTIGGSPPDGDFDQIGPPQGSAFFELYCTASPNQPYYPQELYTPNGSLDIARSVGGGYPVWRIVIGESTDPLGSSSNADAVPKNSIVQRFQEAEFSFQPEQHREKADGTAKPDPLKRSSVLGQSGTATSHEIPIDRIVSFASRTVAVNDDKRTFWNKSSATSLAPNSYLVIAPRTVTQLGSKEYSAGSKFGDASGVGIDTSTFDTNAVVMICENTYDEGVNITQPMEGATERYPTPATVTNTTTDTTYLTYSTVEDEPFERPGGVDTGRPISEDDLVGEGTVPFYKSAFLQRVADPLRAYDTVNNPYITVDWNMMDLTVFRGEQQGGSDDEKLTPQLKPADWPFYVSSRQWGTSAMPTPHPERANPWARAFTTDAMTTGAKGDDAGLTNKDEDATLTDATFKYPPEHTFGQLNVFRVKGDTPSVDPSDPSYPYTDTIQPYTSTTLGGLPTEYLGAPNFVTTTGAAGFIGLPWNNAPFANPLEVMQVPASAPGRFGVEFVDTGTATMSLAEGNSMGTGGRFGADITGGRIGHLLNFFAVDGTNSPPVDSLNLGEFLEFLTVPSRFVGTQHYLNDDPADPVTVSLYREPGKINLNTVPPVDAPGNPISPVWDALKGDRQGPLFAAVETARNGVDALGDPLEFENPFRSASGKANASMLRIPTTGTIEPELEFGDKKRLNTYNELEGLQRLSSMTTNRSNVFAVWVTVGYFEADDPTTWDTPVDPTTLPGVYPQGYAFGKELGYESGEVVRRRAFYIIDRTIPVGFRRGELRNAEDTILLKRVLE